ncbi:MAG: pyruvate kinase, partial [Pseudomonadota bacterium]
MKRSPEFAKRGRNAKIIATLGPGTRSPETVKLLAIAGVDIFRLNFSHGSHEDHKRA